NLVGAVVSPLTIAAAKRKMHSLRFSRHVERMAESNLSADGRIRGVRIDEQKLERAGIASEVKIQIGVGQRAARFRVEDTALCQPVLCERPARDCAVIGGRYAA